MTRLYTCSVCGKVGPARRCPQHPARHGWEQQKFRTAVLLRDGHRCRRCGSTKDLRAAHWPVPLRHLSVEDEPYHPRHGVTFCGDCDRKFDKYARPAR